MSTLLLEQFDQLISSPDDVERLNHAILQLAIHGKLVEQDSNDEPAIKTIQRIYGKKESVKAADNFHLPQGWAWSCLQEVVKKDKHAIKRGPFGSAIKKAYFVPEGHKVYEQGNAIYKDFHRGTYYINDEKFKELSSFEIKPHDIIVSCSGTVGKMAIVPEGIEPGIINQALLKLSLNQEGLLNEYFEIILSAYIMKTNTLADLKGTAIKNITSVKILRTLPFPLPPLAEQQRIVARVKELFAQTRLLAEGLAHSRIELDRLNESTLARLLASETPEEFNERWCFIAEHFDLLTSAPEHITPLRQSILELAVRGRLTQRDVGDEPAEELLKRIKEEKGDKEKSLKPVGEEEKSFELPNGWEWARLIDLGFTQTGSTPPTNNPDFYGSDYAFVKPADITENAVYYSKEGLSKLGIERGRLVKANSIMMVCIGGSIGKVGYIDRDCSCNQQINVLTPSNKLVTKFLYYFLKSPYFQNEVLSRAPKTTLPILSKGKWEVIAVPIPPLAEQERIVKRVEQLLGWCDALEAQLQSAEEERGKLVESVLVLSAVEGLARVGS